MNSAVCRDGHSASAARVRAADHGGLTDRRVPEQHLFDVARGDVEATPRRDEFLHPRRSWLHHG